MTTQEAFVDSVDQDQIASSSGNTIVLCSLISDLHCPHFKSRKCFSWLNCIFFLKCKCTFSWWKNKIYLFCSERVNTGNTKFFKNIPFRFPSCNGLSLRKMLRLLERNKIQLKLKCPIEWEIFDRDFIMASKFTLSAWSSQVRWFIGKGKLILIHERLGVWKLRVCRH